MEKLETLAPTIGRILLSLIFVIMGIGKIFAWSGTAGYMASQGLPFVSILLVLVIIIEAGGGLALLTGYKAKWAALLLAAYLIPTTLIFHQFWGIVDPMTQQMQLINFLKNLGFIGGLLYVFKYGPGPYSIGK